MREGQYSGGMKPLRDQRETADFCSVRLPSDDTQAATFVGPPNRVMREAMFMSASLQPVNPGSQPPVNFAGIGSANKSGRDQGCTGVSLGGRIRQARLARRWSQEALGDLVGRRKAAVSLWESDDREPDFEMQERIAAALGVPLSWLRGKESQATLPFIELAGVVGRGGQLEVTKDRLEAVPLPPG